MGGTSPASAHACLQLSPSPSKSVPGHSCSLSSQLLCTSEHHWFMYLCDTHKFPLIEPSWRFSSGCPMTAVPHGRTRCPGWAVQLLDFMVSRNTQTFLWHLPVPQVSRRCLSMRAEGNGQLAWHKHIPCVLLCQGPVLVSHLLPGEQGKAVI